MAAHPVLLPTLSYPVSQAKRPSASLPAQSLPGLVVPRAWHRLATTVSTRPPRCGPPRRGACMISTPEPRPGAPQPTPAKRRPAARRRRDRQSGISPTRRWRRSTPVHLIGTRRPDRNCGRRGNEHQQCRHRGGPGPGDRAVPTRPGQNGRRSAGPASQQQRPPPGLSKTVQQQHRNPSEGGGADRHHTHGAQHPAGGRPARSRIPAPAGSPAARLPPAAPRR